MQPFNYIIPGQGLMESYSEGLEIQNKQNILNAQAEERAMRAQQLKAAMENARIAQQERERFLNLPEASIQDVIRYSAYLPPEMVKAMQPQFDAMGKERQQGELRFSAELFSAIKSKRPDIAAQLAEQRAQAEKDPRNAEMWKRTAEAIKTAPEEAFKIFAPIVSRLPGAKEMLENLDKALSTARAEELQPGLVKKGTAEADKAEAEATLKKAESVNADPLAAAALQKAEGDAKEAQVKGDFAEKEALARLEVAGMNVKNLKNQIAVSSAKLGLDRQIANATILEKLSAVARNNDKLASMPADVRKSINDAAISSGAAQMQAQRLEKMAADFAAANVGSGSASKINEWFRKQTGYENGLSSLRADYERLSKSVALKSLPPGPASNADLLFAMKGVPESTSNSTEIARFLRGMAIMEKIASDSEQVKVDWLSQNNGALSKAATGFSAAGIQVKPGQTLAEVQSEIVKKHSTQPSPQNSPVSVSFGGKTFSFPDQKSADAFLAAAKK